MMNFTKKQIDLVRLASHIFDSYINQGILSLSELLNENSDIIDMPLIYDDLVDPIIDDDSTAIYPLIANIMFDEDGEFYVEYMHDLDLFDEYDITCAALIDDNNEIVGFGIYDTDQCILIDDTGIYIETGEESEND